MDYKDLINYKTFDELRLSAFDRLKTAASKITNLNIGGVFRTLLELAMQGLADLYTLLFDIVPKGYLMNATGKWLELKGEELGLFKKEDQKAEGYVIFGRSDASGNKMIPAGSIVKTDMTPSGEELRYFTTTDTICNSGILEVMVPVISEFTGVKYNVGEGIIKNIVTHVPGFDYVRNAASWLTKEGSDLEDDESFRQRCQLRWNELSYGGTKLAYESWAWAVPGVIDVLVSPLARGDGTVDVIILSTSGLPTVELINSVQAIINERKPLCTNVLVKGPVAQTINISLTVDLKPDSVLDIDVVSSIVQQYVNAYFGQGVISGINRLGIGKDLILLQLAAILKNIYADIINVRFTLPAGDVVIESHKIAALGTLSITVTKVVEE